MRDAAHVPEAIKTICVPAVNHLQWLNVQNYPRLQLVIVFGWLRIGQKPSNIARGRWTLLISLEVEDCGSCRRSCMTYFLPPSQHSLSSEGYQCYADQLPHYHSGHGRIINVAATQAGSRSRRALARQELPLLSTLTAFGCGLNSQDMFNLSQGNWSSLTQIDLCNNHFDDEALVTASWPRLTFVNLMNCGLDDDAIAELSLSKWPELQSLYPWQEQDKLSCNRISCGGQMALLDNFGLGEYST